MTRSDDKPALLKQWPLEALPVEVTLDLKSPWCKETAVGSLRCERHRWRKQNGQRYLSNIITQTGRCQRKFTSHCSGGCRCQIKVLVGPVPGEAALFGLQTAGCLLAREGELWYLFLFTNPIIGT